MRPAAAMLAAALAALSGAAAAQSERAWSDFSGAGAPPAVILPSTSGIPAAAPSGAAPRTFHDRPAPAAAAPAAPAPETAAPASPASPPPAAAARPASAYAAGTRIAGRAEAVDGHTLHVAGHAVRLHGVEAPGLSQTCTARGGTAWPCGLKAHARLAQLAGGKDVSCVVDEPAGEGAAATCSVRGISDLGRIMAEEGLAVPNGHDRGRYSSAAASARESRAGLWSGTFEAPWTFRRRH